MINLQVFVETLVSMSFSASIVILVVMLVRFIFRKLPKVFQYCLWIFVLIRLVIPFSFESSVSVMNVPQAIVMTVIKEAPAIKEAVDVAPLIKGTSNQISMMEVLMIIWLIGVLTFLTYLVYQMIQVRKKIKFATKLNDQVYEHESISLPFVYGIKKPRIYLPIDLNDEAKKIVLAHEEVHINRKDYIVKWISVVLLMLHWFNPVIWLGYYLMSKDMELSCDEKALDHLGASSKTEFSNIILSYSIQPNLTTLSFGRKDVKMRIKHILNYSKPTFWIIVSCIAIALMIAVPLLSNPKSNLQANNDEPSVAVNDIEEPTISPEVKVETPVQTDEPATIIDNNEPLDFIAPLDYYKVTCDVGCYVGHKGLDIKSESEDSVEVKAIELGEIIEVGYSERQGNYIVIEHRDGYQSLYQHLESVYYSEGVVVNRGDRIGIQGMTGWATGTHVHLEITKDGEYLSNILELIA